MKRLLVGILLITPFFLQAGFDVQFTPDGPITQKTNDAPPATKPLEGLVKVPVADLRREPRSVSPEAVSQRPYALDPHQETQLLFGERVLVFEVKGPWARVEAPDQAEFDHAGRWQGYPGWVLTEDILAHPSDFFPSAVVHSRYARVTQTKKRSSSFMELPMGSRVGVIYTEKGWVRVQGPQGEMGWMRSRDVRLDREAPQKGDDVRKAVLEAAVQFLGEPYYWGGRCGHKKKGNTPTGVDCSGLVNLAYRAVCLNAPRDAHEQFLAATKLKSASDLRPGDLVFLAKKETPNRVAHVMLFEKNETLIEAAPDVNVVRRVSFKKKLGASQKNLHAGDKMGDFIVQFGTFIN